MTPSARLDDPHVLDGSARRPEFDTTPEGTRMRWSWGVEPRGILRMMSPLVVRAERRQEQRIGTGLKRLLENSAG